MGSDKHDGFDVEELLHLAMHASEQERHDEALGYLKRAVELDPLHAKVSYFLGAEYAQLGLYERATQAMARAVELDASLLPAWFQLGLLHITSARLQDAEQAWRALDALGEEHPLYLFKTGMLALGHDRFQDAVSFIDRGLANDDVVESLRKDMQRVRDAAAQALQTQASNAQAAGPERTAAPRHVLASAYSKDDDGMSH